MKKVLFLALFSVFAYVANSQVITMKSSVYSSNSLDTVTNAATKYLVSSASPVVGKHDALVIVTVTEISGTTAGAVTLEGSSDGSNWASVYSSKDSVYSFSPADQAAAQSYAWQLAGSQFKYYRIKYVGTGTMSAKFSAVATISKP